MLQKFIKFFRAWRYRQRQSKYGSCSLYYIESLGIVVPYANFAAHWPGYSVRQMTVQTNNAAQIGINVLQALQASRQQGAIKTKPDFDAAMNIFDQRMEEFRHLSDVGKRRFERNLQLIIIEQIGGSIRLCHQHQCRGRLAFEERKGDTKLFLAESVPHAEIGDAIVDLISNHPIW